MLIGLTSRNVKQFIIKFQRSEKKLDFQIYKYLNKTNSSYFTIMILILI